MRKSRIFLLIVVMVCIGVIVYGVMKINAQPKEEQAGFAVVNELHELITSESVYDVNSEKLVEGALRGWNEDWSVGENTFSDSHGRFSLVSNDIMSHFEISAPGYEKKKFDKRIDYQPAPNPEKLPERTLEYQQIRESS